MTRALIHIGLAVVLVLAPTLCCCKGGWFLPAPQQARSSLLLATQVPAPDESCCLKAKKTCCATNAHDHTSKPFEKSAPTHAPDCACCAERPEAAPPEGKIVESDPQPTGELLSLGLVGLLGYSEHTVTARVARSRDGTGVDARYSALFERHVLRC